MSPARPSGPLYATPAQARADTERLQLHRVGAAPWALLATIEGVVLNPRSNSDTLLIHADALRATADALGPNPASLGITRLADILADIAPTRANPVAHDRAAAIEATAE